MKIKTDVFINTIKIAAAAITAILIANMLGLEFAVSAGIVAILTIQPTKKETIRTALGRFYAFIMAVIIAYVSFNICGFNNLGFFIYLFIFIFICQIFKWYSAMAMNSVLISHFMTFGEMNGATVKNEILIFLIGVGIGIFANLHLVKKADYMERLKDRADKQIVNILYRMSERVLNKDICNYDGNCLVELNEQIQKAKNQALENYNNQFGTKDVYDMEYIEMREKQSQILYEMYKNIRNLDTTPSTAKVIAEFLEKIALNYNENNDGLALIEEFNEINLSMKGKKLPVERKEFENRARLFILLRSIEEFINIKIEFYKKYRF